MKVLEAGNLWVSVEYKGIRYTLAYTHGLDITTIYREWDDPDKPLEYINYFYGGFNLDTGKPDTGKSTNIYEAAIYYINNKEEN